MNRVVFGYSFTPFYQQFSIMNIDSPDSLGHSGFVSGALDYVSRLFYLYHFSLESSLCRAIGAYCAVIKGTTRCNACAYACSASKDVNP